MVYLWNLLRNNFIKRFNKFWYMGYGKFGNLSVYKNKMDLWELKYNI